MHAIMAALTQAVRHELITMPLTVTSGPSCMLDLVCVLKRLIVGGMERKFRLAGSLATRGGTHAQPPSSPRYVLFAPTSRV